MNSLTPTEIRTKIELARNGCADSLGDLLEFYRHYLRLMVGLKVDGPLQGKVSASDVIQEAFLAVHRQIQNFRGQSETQWLSWLRQILASQIAMQYRRYLTQGRDVGLEHRIEADLTRSSQNLSLSIVGREASPSEHMVREEQGVLLARALHLLSREYREVIVLRHLRGMQFSEVAAHMGRTIDSVKSIWTRALRKLREFLAGDE